MKAALDVVSDNISDCCNRFNCTPKQLFVEAVQSMRQWSNIDEVAERHLNIWVRSGYQALCKPIKDFVLEKLNSVV